MNTAPSRLLPVASSFFLPTSRPSSGCWLCPSLLRGFVRFTQNGSFYARCSSSARATSRRPNIIGEEGELEAYQLDVDDVDHINGALHSHTPVLQKDVISGFRSVKLHAFVDCTLGAAGHAASIIKEHLELKTFVGLDVDPVAHSQANVLLQDALEHRRMSLGPLSELDVHLQLTNFKYTRSILRKLHLLLVDGILMDLGMSSMQLHGMGRGFSIQQDGPLDMRMDPTCTMTASEILNSWPESEIGRILREYGEERYWKRLARRICEAQTSGGLHSTREFLELIKMTIPNKYSPGRQGWKKTAIRVFQALRIAVNDEVNNLEAALPNVYACLAPKGRLAVISFHSLEDRIVKQFFLQVMGEVVKRKASKDEPKADLVGGIEDFEELEGSRTSRNILEGSHALVLTKKPIVAEDVEIRSNPKARSAKLRIIEKK